MQQLDRDDVVADRYQIVGLLGAGGMGTVYKAHHLGLEVDVAVKTLNLDHGEIKESEMAEFFARFKKEAQALTQLHHTGIVNVMDFGLHGKTTPYLVMDYFPGQPVLKWGERETPSTSQWLGVFRQIFEALSHAHEHGVLHRDIKSGNVLVDGTAAAPKVRLIDWGISYAGGSTRLTQKGMVAGSLGFTDPEVIEDSEKDFAPQSDLYAVGVLMFEALCGRPPFDVEPGASDSARRRAIVANRVIAPNEVDSEMSDDLNDFIMKLMSTRQQHRPTSAKASLFIVDALLSDQPVDFDAVFAANPTPVVTMKSAKLAPTEALNEDAEFAASMKADLARAQARSEKLTRNERANAPKPSATPEVEVSHVLDEAAIDASALPLAAQQSIRSMPQALHFEANAARMNLKVGKAPSSWKRNTGLVAALVVGGVLAALAMNAANHRAQQTAAPDMALVQRTYKAEDLDAKRDESALAKFGPVTAPPAKGSLSSFPADIKAEYDTTLGGGDTLPVNHFSAGKVAPRKEEKFDKSMKAVAMVGGDAARNDKLSIPYNTEVVVRLLENLDTSNDEAVRVELKQPLIVDQRVVIPYGSIFSGHASFRYNRAQARFDKVTFPDGHESRVSALAVNRDGREGIDGGRLEFGDLPKDKTGEKVLRAMGTIANGAVSTIPGGDALSQAAQQVTQDEVTDATQAQQTAVRSKTRIILPRKTEFTVKFQMQ